MIKMRALEVYEAKKEELIESIDELYMMSSTDRKILDELIECLKEITDRVRK